MIIVPANTLSTGAFEVANSLRLNDGDSGKMLKQMGTATDNKKFTFNCWLKRSTLGTNQVFAHARNGTSGPYFNMMIGSDDKLRVYGPDKDGGNDFDYKTTQVLRDVNAWYCITVAFDSSHATAGNRIRMYINGVEVTDFATETNPAEDVIYVGNYTGYDFGIGANLDNSAYFDGYIAECVHIDGQQLTPSSFGEFDEDSPTIWKPKSVTGLTFGNNGFYLDFEDSSNLGNDANGGTDLTETNIAAGDQSVSTPTLNYPTWNSLTRFGDASLSEGNSRFTGDTGNYTQCGTTFAASKGKWYFEMKHSQTRSKIFAFYLHDVLNTLAAVTANHNFFISTNSTGTTSFYLQLANTNHATNRDYTVRKYVDQTQSTVTSTGGNIANAMSPGILGVYLDLDNRRIHYYNNNTALDSGDADAADGGFGDIPAGTYSFGVSENSAPDAGDDGVLLLDLNFGDPNANITISSGNTDANGYGNFEYSPTVGSVNYYAMNSKNLAEFG